MAMEGTFEPVEARGWRLGLANLLARENRKWWASSRWWMQAMLWTGVLVGLFVMVLIVVPTLSAASGDPVMEQDPVASALQGFFSVGAFALAIGITILLQDEVIREKESGTAEWVLSKPASRSAFLLSKLTAHTLGMLVALIGIPSLVAYGVLWVAEGAPYPIAPFLGGVAVLALHVFFYLALTLMMGVLANRTGVVLAVALGTLLGGSLIRNFLPAPSLTTPWLLPDIGGLLAMGEPLPVELTIPILATAAWCVVFLVVAFWAFRRHEF